MAPVVREMLVEHMQLSQYLALDIVAAEATFQMNNFHVERRKYQRTFCSDMIEFNPIRFAGAERQEAAMGENGVADRLTKAAAGGLARFVAFPDGFKVRYRLEALGIGAT